MTSCNSWSRQSGKVYYAMKKDQSYMVWARTDLVAVLVVVCGGWHLWGEFSEWEVFCIVGRIWRPACILLMEYLRNW